MDEIARIIKARNQKLFVKQQSFFTDLQPTVAESSEPKTIKKQPERRMSPTSLRHGRI